MGATLKVKLRNSPRRLPKRRSTVAAGLLASACAGVALVAAPIFGAAPVAPSVATLTGYHVVRSDGFSRLALQRVGTVNMRDAVAKYTRPTSSSSNAERAPQVALNRLLRHPATSAAADRAALPKAVNTARFGVNVPGEHGFDGVTALINGGANSPDVGSVGDVSPPDQGLAVGPSPAGTVLVEFLNDTLNIYAPNGNTLLGAVPAFQVFGLPPNAFLSDPRAYWDPATGHWFLTMFTVGNSGATIKNGECSNGAAPPKCLSEEFVDVSTTTNPFGNYAVFAIDTSDSSNSANGCPCFGDYDMLGADHNGIYIETNEFPLNSGGPGFNGSVIYAMSKAGLIAAANGAPSPVVERYTVPFTSDPFAGYHLSPSTVTQGAPAPSREYFVESNANLPNNATARNLEVFALLDTRGLKTGAKLPLVENTVSTETYSELPPNAVQKSGPTPLGTSVGFQGTPVLQTDFNAVQEVTYASGDLYAELDTGFGYKSGTNSGAAWFILHPTVTSGHMSVKLVRQGYVETSQNLLYPVIGVNRAGTGFMAFAVAGPNYYPSAAYVSFSRAQGAGNVVHVAARGVAPLDDFTCYPYFHFSTGQCRYGDYSMAQEYKGDIYMATEYVGPQPRDTLSNWGTRVFWAPVSAG